MKKSNIILICVIALVVILAVVANIFGFEKAIYFEADASSSEVPSVNFE